MTDSSRLLPAALLGLLLSSPAAAAEKGAWWEMTSEMEMVGMPFAMPPTTMKLCLPESEWNRPPEGKQDPNCQMKDLKRSGNTMKWRMVCTGKEPMEGEGEMTRTGDSLSGLTRITSARGNMNMKLRGKKSGGPCDAEEQRRKMEEKVEGYKAQAKEAEEKGNAAQAKQCEDAIRDMSVAAVAGSYTVCKDPAKKAEFCARARTEEGFAALMRSAEPEKSSRGMVPGPKAAAKACDLDLEEVKQGLCARAAKAERPEQLGFLSAQCPAEAKALAKRECAGRDYTRMQGSRYRDFCGRVAGSQLDEKERTEEGKPADAEKKPDAMDTGKKLLKGVFGF
jgi:hypothetical protein